MRHAEFGATLPLNFVLKLEEPGSNFWKVNTDLWGTFFFRAQVFRWHKSFSEGREHIEDQYRSEKPSISKTDENIESFLLDELLTRYFMKPYLKDSEETRHYRQMDAVSWQHFMSHCRLHNRLFLPQNTFLWFPSTPYSISLSPCFS